MKTEKFIIMLLTLTSLLSCNVEREEMAGERYGSINAGKINVVCDESLYGLMDSAFTLYTNAYPKIELELEVLHARRAMALLLSGETDAIITARSFLKDEDSLMKAYDVDRPEMIIASDALVFFVKNDFPLDTLNDKQLVGVLSGRKKLIDYFPVLNKEPEFASNITNSSEFANLQNLVLKGNELIKYINTFNGIDSVMDYVSQSSNVIGIGYLSQIYGNSDFKMLQIGFINQNGTRIFPQVVHQGFIVQGKYPYISKIRVYIKEDNKTAPFFWFASYLSKEAVVQKYLLDKGIVPEYAKFKLRQEK
ncbi:MAG: substrate-binding domain-containing protein [Candidatus Kapabacteria bacterium]|nr:substrate-binding domain-containing protein [Ignavibacteriota bacterium]MCW5884465.1 substrate-binding domain-containing protein [Candidatus Kapabacteria bacterium]